MKSLEQYLREAQADGVIDHSLRIHSDHDGKIIFYIHPANVSGQTCDYKVDGNVLQPWDWSATLKEC